MTVPLEVAAGRAIRRRRQALNISQRTLAERSGVSASQLSKIENGKVSSWGSTLEKIAQGLGLSFGRFLGLVADEVGHD